MSTRTRWLLAIIGLLIICLALAGLAYSLWPLADTQERFIVPVEMMVVMQIGRWGLFGG
ncbi:MAG: hypothetical protein WAM60_11125 [Candidatus Promineifilaceae bacterium]